MIAVAPEAAISRTLPTMIAQRPRGRNDARRRRISSGGGAGVTGGSPAPHGPAITVPIPLLPLYMVPNAPYATTFPRSRIATFGGRDAHQHCQRPARVRDH